ncbi:MAG: biotin/lipoyl-binding protein, partial [Gemmataceae bacterium]|nr:biotin/lipoyl-binding protein [Gemmataceae bacterium]
MNWLRKTRPVLLVVGLGLAVASLLGARALNDGREATGKDASAPRSATAGVGGLVVLGTVDTDPPPVEYRLPAVLQSGTVAKVLVKDGQAVKARDVLYTFDATTQQAKVESAKRAVELAQTKVREAEEGKKQHANGVAVAKEGVKALERRAGDADRLVNLTAFLADEANRLNKVAPEDFPARRLKDAGYVDALAKYTAA